MTTLTAAGRPPTDRTASGVLRLLLTLCGITALLRAATLSRGAPVIDDRFALAKHGD
ncbi:hypothetical protein [Streptomyces sp. NPDC017890]|uniref:hypothetical protein n=1 Tax=Streptomyces sp. NPDC017890 TaxID=3365015 RepID=UPI0037AB584C